MDLKDLRPKILTFIITDYYVHRQTLIKFVSIIVIIPSIITLMIDDKYVVMIDALNSASRYLDDLLNIDNIHFEQMVHRIYPAKIQLNKANASDYKAVFFELNLSIHNDAVSSKIYDKRDDFDIVNFPFLDPSMTLLWCINISTYSLCQSILT